MFGIGFSEMLLIAVVVLIAVGPQRLPQMMKTLGRGLREIRRASNELRRSVGFDEMMRDADLRSELRDLPPPPAVPRVPSSPVGEEEGPEASPPGSEDRVVAEKPPPGDPPAAFAPPPAVDPQHTSPPVEGPPTAPGPSGPGARGGSGEEA